MKNIPKLIVASAVLLALLFTSGCNTFRGLGEDVQSLGESMQNAGN